MSDTHELTLEEGREAADILNRMQPTIWMSTSLYSDEELELVAKSLDALEWSLRPRDTLAELFGMSAMSQSDQNVKAKLPAIRLFIELCRAVKEIPGASKHQYLGKELFDGL